LVLKKFLKGWGGRGRRKGELLTSEILEVGSSCRNTIYTARILCKTELDFRGSQLFSGHIRGNTIPDDF